MQGGAGRDTTGRESSIFAHHADKFLADVQVRVAAALSTRETRSLLSRFAFTRYFTTAEIRSPFFFDGSKFISGIICNFEPRDPPRLFKVEKIIRSIQLGLIKIKLKYYPEDDRVLGSQKTAFFARKVADKRVNTQNVISALTPDDTEGGEQPRRRGRGRVFTPSWSRAGKNHHPPPRSATERKLRSLRQEFETQCKIGYYKKYKIFDTFSIYINARNLVCNIIIHIILYKRNLKIILYITTIIEKLKIKCKIIFEKYFFIQ